MVGTSVLPHHRAPVHARELHVQLMTSFCRLKRVQQHEILSDNQVVSLAIGIPNQLPDQRNLAAVSWRIGTQFSETLLLYFGAISTQLPE